MDDSHSPYKPNAVESSPSLLERFGGGPSDVLCGAVDKNGE